MTLPLRMLQALRHITKNIRLSRSFPDFAVRILRFFGIIRAKGRTEFVGRRHTRIVFGMIQLLLVCKLSELGEMPV